MTPTSRPPPPTPSPSTSKSVGLVQTGYSARNNHENITKKHPWVPAGCGAVWFDPTGPILASGGWLSYCAIWFQSHRSCDNTAPVLASGALDSGDAHGILHRHALSCLPSSFPASLFHSHTCLPSLLFVVPSLSSLSSLVSHLPPVPSFSLAFLLSLHSLSSLLTHFSSISPLSSLFLPLFPLSPRGEALSERGGKGRVCFFFGRASLITQRMCTHTTTT